ncbi:lysophospholipase L1-like esterase, partial [Methylobacterium sp. RAS18]|nr:lysophospholipase L1-like esterase [Methylobacterium sp. RAS18]
TLATRTYVNDAVATEKNDRIAAVTSEKNDRIAAVATEKSQREAAVANEAMLRGMGDAGNAQALQAGLQSIDQDWRAGVVAERGDRIAAVTDVSNRLTTETNLRAEADTKERTDRVNAVNATNASLNDARTRLAVTEGVASTVSRILTARPRDRMGDAPEFFMLGFSQGPAEAAAAVPAALLTTGADGSVLRVTDPVTIALRRYEPIETGRVYRDSFAFRRAGNSIDPAGDAIEVGFAWYDQNKGFISAQGAETRTNIRASSGLVEIGITLARVAAQGIDVVPPAAACYRRPYIRVYGTQHVTDLVRLGTADITDAVAYSPDVTDVLARLAAYDSQSLPDRLEALESAADAPLSATYTSRASAAADTVAPVIGLKRVLGYVSAGDGGGADYRRLREGETVHPFYTFQTSDNAKWRPVSDAWNVRMAGARGDGVTSDLVAFRDGPRGPRIRVDPGNYVLGNNILDFGLKFEFTGPGVNFVGGQLYADIKRPYLADIVRPTLAGVVRKMVDNQLTTIFCIGDSETYSLLGDYSTTNTQDDNGYSAAVGGVVYRSSVTYPQSLQAALRSVHQYNGSTGQNITVRNCGYPGDHTYEMLNRWKNVGFSDVTIIMAGTNDGIDSRPIEQLTHFLRELVELRLEVGSLPIIMLPPEAPTLEQNTRIQLFRAAAADVADEYSLLCIDARDQLRPLGAAQWVGLNDVHLSLAGYKLLGWDIAALFSPAGVNEPIRLGPGMRVTAGDMPAAGFGGHITQAPYITSRDKFVMQIDPNYTASIPVYVDEDCAPVLEIVNPDVNKNRHMAYGRVGADAVTATFSNPPADGVYRKGYALPMLHRGYRLLQLRGAGDAEAFFDAITCHDPADYAHTAAGMYRSSSLTGVRRPGLFSGTGAWHARESKFVPWVQHIDAEMILDAVGGNGVCIFADEISNEAYGSPNQIMALRDGAALVLRELRSGVSYNGDVTFPGIYPATGRWTGRVHCHVSHPDPGQAFLNVFVDDVYVGRRPTTITGGYVAIVSTSPGYIKCAAMEVMEG